jgi:hypothetical protein
MKNYLHVLFMLFTLQIIAQTPTQLNYQAVVRDANGNIVPSNTAVQFKFTIHETSPTGTAVYTETSNIILTNQFGLTMLAIGSNASLSSVNWSTGNKYLNVQMKIGNGSFIDMGTTQILSVPYALYSANAAIADSIRGGGASSSQNSVVTKYNGLPLSDASINHAVLSVSSNFVSALTSTNYAYGLYRGTNNIQTFASTAILASDTTSGTPALYISAFPLGCSGSNYPYQGQIFGVNTNHTTGIYYVPLSATGTASPPQLYSYSCTTGHWTPWQSQLFNNYQYFQLLPNSNAVTGFNLQFPLVVTITR